MWWQANQIENLGGMLNDLKARYNIDENAVYLMGVSDGATGAFYHAFKAPTPWAGFLSFNGHPVVLANRSTGADGQMYVINLRNKPFFVIWFRELVLCQTARRKKNIQSYCAGHK